MLWFLIWVSILNICPSQAGYCYSCSGICKSELCNCQMGSCESDYCFAEKKTDPTGLSKIIKGCVKRPARKMPGCDFDRNKDSISCTCVGDFCNDVIHMRPQLRRNITCKQCEERDSDCSDQCTGQWCYETTTGKTGCGFGPPTLPFFYETAELLMHRSKVCIQVSRGNGMPAKHCIWLKNYTFSNTHLCNDLFRSQALFGILPAHQRSRSVTYIADVTPKIHKCISCDVSTHDSSVTTSCRQNACFGHYCTYMSNRILISGLSQRSPSQAIIHEKQGCINVTDSRHVKLGCLHKWTSNEEELSCLCAGDDCNIDLNTASLSSAPITKVSNEFKLITCLFLLSLLLISS